MASRIMIGRGLKVPLCDECSQNLRFALRSKQWSSLWLRLHAERQGSGAAYHLFITSGYSPSDAGLWAEKVLLCEACCRLGTQVVQESGGSPADLELQVSQYGLSDQSPTFYMRMPPARETGQYRPGDRMVG